MSTSDDATARAALDDLAARGIHVAPVPQADTPLLNALRKKWTENFTARALLQHDTGETYHKRLSRADCRRFIRQGRKNAQRKLRGR